MKSSRKPGISFAKVVPVAVAAGALAIAGCGSSSSSSKSDTSSGGASTTGASSQKRLDLAMQIGLSNQKFAQDMFTGGRDAAAKQNAKLNTAAPTNIDPPTSINQVQSLLSQQPDGVVIWDVPAALWGSMLKKAQTATKNNVVTIDTPPLPSANVPFVGNNNLDFGRTLVSATLKKSKLTASTTGTVLVGVCVPQDSLLSDRAKGMRAELAKELPNATVQQFDSQADPGKTFTAWDSKVRSSSDVVAAFGACAQDGPAMLKATASKPVVIGASEASPQNDAALKSGKISALVAGNYYLQGYAAVTLTAKAARGEKLPTGWIDVGFDTFTPSTADSLIKREASEAATRAYYASRLADVTDKVASLTKPLAAASK